MNNLPGDLLRPERHRRIQRVVERVRQVYDLGPRFWKIRPDRKADLLACYGNGEDRQEAMAMIVGICLEHAIDRKEMVFSLGVANGTVGRYALIYKRIPDETKAIVKQLTGELASKARKEFLELDDGAGNTEN